MSLPTASTQITGHPLNSEPLGSGMRQASRLEALQDINEPDLQLIVWQRQPQPLLARFVDALAPAQFPHMRLLVRTRDAKQALTQLLQSAPAGALNGVNAFVEDVTALCDQFSQVSGSDKVDIRIEHITHDACWKFHRDCVPLRLLCTYRGHGTQIVPLDCSDKALKSQRDYQGPLLELQPYEVALFKGSQQSEAGVVHRSPPIQGTGESRLMVCLNVPSDVSPAMFEPAAI